MTLRHQLGFAQSADPSMVSCQLIVRQPTRTQQTEGASGLDAREHKRGGMCNSRGTTSYPVGDKSGASLGSMNARKKVLLLLLLLWLATTVSYF